MFFILRQRAVINELFLKILGEDPNCKFSDEDFVYLLRANLSGMVSNYKSFGVDYVKILALDVAKGKKLKFGF